MTDHISKWTERKRKKAMCPHDTVKDVRLRKNIAPKRKGKQWRNVSALVKPQRMKIRKA